MTRAAAHVLKFAVQLPRFAVQGSRSCCQGSRSKVRAAADKIQGPAAGAAGAGTIQPRDKGRGSAALTMKIKRPGIYKKNKKKAL